MPSRAVRLVLLGLLVLFALSRLYHLTLLPVFLDESLHVYWPRRLLEKHRFFYHLLDGKSLQIWLLASVRLAREPTPGRALAYAALAPFAAFALVSRAWFPRYLVSSAVPFAVLAGQLLAQGLTALRGAPDLSRVSRPLGRGGGDART
jgi:hypothetical protein